MSGHPPRQARHGQFSLSCATATMGGPNNCFSGGDSPFTDEFRELLRKLQHGQSAEQFADAFEKLSKFLASRRGQLEGLSPQELREFLDALLGPDGVANVATMSSGYAQTAQPSFLDFLVDAILVSFVAAWRSARWLPVSCISVSQPLPCCFPGVLGNGQGAGAAAGALAPADTGFAGGTAGAGSAAASGAGVRWAVGGGLRPGVRCVRGGWAEQRLGCVGRGRG